MQELKAHKRKELGKKTNALRRAGFLPAVIYGEGVISEPISVNYKDFEKAYKISGESTLLQLDVSGRPHNVLIYDIKHDPLTGKPIHADFYAVSMDKEIKTKVPIEFLGESPAVKNEGGILVKVMQEVELEALPRDLPRGISIDISFLIKFEDRILVANFILPKGVKIVPGKEEVVALVEPPRSEEELEKLVKKEEEAAPIEVKTEKEIKAEAKKEKELELAEEATENKK